MGLGQGKQTRLKGLPGVRWLLAPAERLRSDRLHGGERVLHAMVEFVDQQPLSDLPAHALQRAPCPLGDLLAKRAVATRGIPETNDSRSVRERVIDLAQREKLTVRQLAQRLGGYSGLAFVGTPATIADEMEEWLTSDGSDGFNVMFPFLPVGLDDFVDNVVPELQRRGIFRGDYEGATLREHLGLPRPENRFFSSPASRPS